MKYTLEKKQTLLILFKLYVYFWYLNRDDRDCRYFYLDSDSRRRRDDREGRWIRLQNRRRLVV